MSEARQRRKNETISKICLPVLQCLKKRRGVAASDDTATGVETPFCRANSTQDRDSEQRAWTPIARSSFAGQHTYILTCMWADKYSVTGRTIRIEGGSSGNAARVKFGGHNSPGLYRADSCTPCCQIYKVQATLQVVYSILPIMYLS